MLSRLSTSGLLASCVHHLLPLTTTCCPGRCVRYLVAAGRVNDRAGRGRGRDRRFRVEHAQHMTAPLEGQPRRMARVGAVASVQPTHMVLDRNLAGRDPTTKSTRLGLKLGTSPVCVCGILYSSFLIQPEQRPRKTFV
jgi:hypothetical protein